MDTATEAEFTILRQRANTEVNECFNQIAHSFDLHGDELTADRPKWQAIRSQLVVLIVNAYTSNHTI
jgi:hypothetical protein